MLFPRSGLLAGLAVLPALATCGLAVGDGPGCRLDGPPVALPGRLSETSGLAVGVHDPRRIWTHNDSGNGPFIYALDAEGKVRARVELDRRNRDWEDMDRGRCELGSCLYIADTGDNDERRDRVHLYRIQEPDGDRNSKAKVTRYRMELPDGPRDIEAMYVLPGEDVYFISKGRNHPITLYRYPPPLRADTVVTLVAITRLSEGPAALPRQVTGASATLDGTTVVVRTYETLEFFSVTEDHGLSRTEDGRVNLRTLREPQGEAVAFDSEGRIILSSESARGTGSSMVFLTCEID